MSLPLNQIVQGDCVEVLQGFPDNCIDLVVTDPPYGMSFMGKEWDRALPPLEAFKEMHRVLKPGALCFVMSSPRQDLMWRMMKLLEDAGFEMKQSFISWIYKTGFPKAYDVSKGIDKKLGKEREVVGLSYEGMSSTAMKPDKGWHNNNMGIELKITAPSSDEAKQWDGWKSITGLKPAAEVLIRIQKPFTKQQRIYLILTNLLISLSRDESNWLKLIALTVENNSTQNHHTLNEDGENSVQSHAKMNTNVKQFTAKTVEEYLEWTSHPNASSVPENVPQPIIQALITRLGREVGSNEAMNISQHILEMENTGSNMILLWKNTLIALLLKMSNATTKTESEMTTELRILNSLLCQDTSLNITRVNEIIQNGLKFDALTVINCFKSVLLRLNNIPYISVQEDAIMNMEKQNSHANNVENISQLSTSMQILESIAHGNVMINPVPSLEPVLMVNKPLSEKTIVDNVLKWGTGAINIDKCRIPIPLDEPVDLECNRTSPKSDGLKMGLFKENGKMGSVTSQGRFPANLLVSDGALDTGELSKSGKYEANHVFSRDENGIVPANVYGKYKRLSPEEYPNYADVGDQSRYFDLDAWAEHHGILDVPKPDNKERDFGLKGKKQRTPKGNYEGRDLGNPKNHLGELQSSISRNTHPTVKPIKLMSYLIELGCPKDGVVMDPFVGSGTTCIAAKQLCRRYIGIELNPEYRLLAEARIAAYPQPLEWFTEVLR